MTEALSFRGNPDIPAILEAIIGRTRDVADPDKIIVFGSIGRGDANPESDIDLLVIKSGKYDPILLAGDIYVNLRGIRHSVDVIVSSPEEIEIGRQFQGSVFYSALREGRVIYEAKTSPR